MKGRRETTSIYLRPGVLDALRKLSEQTDVPVAHYLREAVDDLLLKRGIRVAEGRTAKASEARKGQR
jgi:predicted DNA-binding protein